MIKIFKKFFRFSGEHRRAWYLSVVLEFLRCIAEAIQFFPLFLVLLHLVDGTMTPAVAWTALGLVALSVALQAVLHYFSHKLEMRACYLMLDDKRISIGERMKYMPMGYFNDRSLGNLTARKMRPILQSMIMKPSENTSACWPCRGSTRPSVWRPR